MKVENINWEKFKEHNMPDEMETIGSIIELRKIMEELYKYQAAYYSLWGFVNDLDGAKKEVNKIWGNNHPESSIKIDGHYYTLSYIYRQTH